MVPAGLDRRTLRNELLIVLALSFFASALYAVIYLAEDLVRLADPFTAPIIVSPIPRGIDPFVLARSIVVRLTELVPVALVAHLFTREGSSMRRIGFDRTRLRSDIVLGAALALAAHAAAVGATLAAKALGIPFRPIIGTNADAPPEGIILLVVIAVTAAISEEVIVNGYLITRLEDLGWSARRAVATSALLRAVFHLYQGIGGFVGNVVGGVVAATIFIRTRRVMPLVIAHLLIDLIAFFGDFFFGEHLSFLR